MNFNISQTHPLIKKSDNFFIEKKLISIHSEDRDKRAWRNANHFEVQLPDVIKNLQSINLINSFLHIDNTSQQNTVNYNQTHVYMEIDKFNTIDEMEPYPINSNSSKHNRSGGRNDASFAVIPIVPFRSDHLYVTENGDIANVSYYHTPIEKVSKLKLKFRYHNGDLVDFGDNEIHVLLQLNMLVGEPDKY